jgi:hypothetical protein
MQQERFGWRSDLPLRSNAAKLIWVAQRFTAAFKCSKADLGGAAVYRCVQMQQ